jgi:tellurite resistance protein
MSASTIDRTAVPAVTVRPGAAAAVHIPPNLFGIATGISGLAAVWQVAHDQGLVPEWPATVLFALAAATWLVLVVAWARQFRSGRRSLTQELRDPVFGPFVALLPIAGMALGLALTTHAPVAGRVVFGCSAGATLGVGCWLAVVWLTDGRRLDVVHSGYLLPLVAGGMLAAADLARLGHSRAAWLAMGLGLAAWAVLGPLVLARLLRRGSLPTALIPTLAIEITPPVLAGNAYLALSGGRVDAVAVALGVCAAGMAVVQLALVAHYRRIVFGPAVWAFAFAYSATAVLALQWIGLARPPGAALLAALVLVAISGLVAVIAVRTVIGLLRGTFPAVTPG